MSNKKTSSVGSGLLSQGPTSQLPSALEGLTTRFGMGLGVPPPLEPPTELDFHLLGAATLTTEQNAYFKFYHLTWKALVH